MAKLFNIVAVSVGSGIFLGAGLRMLEGAAQQEGQSPRNGVGSGGYSPDIPPSGEGWPGGERKDPSAILLARLSGVEQRMEKLSREPAVQTVIHADGPADPAKTAEQRAIAAALQKRLDAQRAEAESIRASLESAERSIEKANRNTERIGTELREWAAQDIERRVSEVGSRIEQNITAVRQDMLDALVDGVQMKVVSRISRLEEEVAGQSSAMLELRDCSIKTEHSIQRLLDGIDRLAKARTGETLNLQELPVMPSPEVPPAPPVARPVPPRTPGREVPRPEATSRSRPIPPQAPPRPLPQKAAAPLSGRPTLVPDEEALAPQKPTVPAENHKTPGPDRMATEDNGSEPAPKPKRWSLFG